MPNIDKEIVQSYLKGESLASLKKRFNKSWKTLTKILEQEKVKKRTFKEVQQIAGNKRIGQRNLACWKGGRFTDSRGYIVIYKPEYEGKGKRFGKYVLEHIYVWVQAKGPLPEDYIVHHINGIRTDNRLENLIAMPRKKHPSHTFNKILQEQIRKLEKRVEELEKQLGRK